jgi:hypothetical protein
VAGASAGMANRLAVADQQQTSAHVSRAARVRYTHASTI